MTFDFKWQFPVLPRKLNEHSQEVGVPVENWQPCRSPPSNVMSGQYCRLEPFDIKLHSDGLFKAFSLDTHARNWTYLPYGPFEHKHQFVDWCSESCVGEDPLFHTVVDQSDDRITGMASYLRISPDVGSIEVGHIHFSPIIQRTRLATEAMFLMMCRVFDELGYRRYEWKCDALNAPSCGAAQRFGFKFEGIFRQALVYKQRNRDTAWFAILDSDWPTLRKGYEEWLAKENFYADGQQIRTLTQCIDDCC
ncbi:MAG: GNAT family N-acetyltransferase [Granulosicoccus sp.]